MSHILKPFRIDPKNINHCFMKKYIIAIIIIGLVATIVTREINSFNLRKENKQLSDTILRLKSQLDTKERSIFDDFKFNWVTCTPVYDKIIRTGDSLSIKVTLTARNSISDIYKMKEAYVTLGKGIDFSYNLIDVYDTINAKDWLCEMKIKTQGLGFDTLYGDFNIPWDNNSQLRYPFKVTYYKIDDGTYDGIFNLLKANKKK